MQCDEGQQLAARERSQRAAVSDSRGSCSSIQVKHGGSNNQPIAPNTRDVRQRRIIMNRASFTDFICRSSSLLLQMTDVEKLTNVEKRKVVDGSCVSGKQRRVKLSSSNPATVSLRLSGSEARGPK